MMNATLRVWLFVSLMAVMPAASWAGNVFQLPLEDVPKEELSREAKLARQLVGEVRQLDPMTRGEGEPFFPIGAYGLPKNISVKDITDNGWNVLRYHVPPGQVPDRSKHNALYEKFLRKAEDAGLMVIVMAQHLVLQGDREGYVERLRRLMDYDSFMGFYLVDEPENHWWSYDTKSDDFIQYLKERGLDPADMHPDEGESPFVGWGDQLSLMGRVVRENIGWARQLFNVVNHDPDEHTFLLIGWGDHYYELGPVTDVLMANRYPRVERENGRIVSGSLCNVVWDARNAAAAATTNGRMGFIYTPMALDNFKDRAPQEDVLRYTFFAPVTQGAMGVVTWAGYRNSAEYARSEVFPVTRQLNELSNFFLGDWLDEKLSWAPRDADSPCLRKFLVPRVSACLRQAKNGRYMLLATNNAPEPTEATFTVDMENLPSQASEYFQKETVSISENGEIRDRMSPYAVKAYIFEKP